MTDLQQMEARAIAAELTIAKMHSSLSDEADYCSDDGPNEAMRWQGKLEFYSRSYREDGYAAARELIEKAEQVDELKDIASRAYEFLTGDDVADPTAEQWDHAWVCGNHRTIEIDDLRTRLRESEALVARLKGSLQSLHSQCEEHLPGYAYSEQETANEELLALAPDDALSEYRDEVLESVAKLVDGERKEAHGFRNSLTASGDLKSAERYHLMMRELAALSNKIRAMKAPEKGGK